ncbi:MAG: amidohydrolase, partial [Chitinophagaceae bacterium]
IIAAVTFLSCNSGGNYASEESAEKQVGESDSKATVYFGGDILTMESDSAQYAEAVVIKDGRILYAGSKDEAMKQAGEGHIMTDLGNKTMLPGFIDAHGHLWMAGLQALSANLLPPPDGEGTNIASLIEIGNKWKIANQPIIDKIGWIIGNGYDEAQLKEKRHPTAADLDKISTQIPILFLHQSGHIAAMNTKGLEVCGINETTKDPKGGIIQHIAGSKKPNGVLEESAVFFPAGILLKKIDDNGNEVLIQAGLKSYSSFGFTTAQEGRASAAICETYKRMSEAGTLTMDVDAYPDIQMETEYMRKNGVQADYKNHFRIAGVKLSLDGSPSGKTAWLTKPYKVPPAGMPKNYRGYPAIPDQAEVNSLIAEAFKNNWQIITHCNGDATIDSYIKAVRLAANQYGNNDRRTVTIHAQVIREDQLDSMKVLGIIPSFFSMHTFYWGDWHRDETLGKERAYRISPTASALKRGMIFTEHHDAPVAFPDAIRILSATVNRVSRSGDIIGPDQRVSPYVALKSLTDWAAYSIFGEKIKGTITAGKLADFVILDKNPVKIDPMAIGDLKVMATIKEGKTIYSAN